MSTTMAAPSAEDMIRESEMRRSEAFHVRQKPLYSLERIRRRTLCEAICEGVPDAVLMEMRGMMQSAAKKAREAAELAATA